MNRTLDVVHVLVTYPDGQSHIVEFSIEPDIIMDGSARMRPGVVYRTSQFGANEDIGETIAYGINDGQCVQSETDEYDSNLDPTGRVIKWNVIDPEPLYRHYVQDRPFAGNSL